MEIHWCPIGLRPDSAPPSLEASSSMGLYVFEGVLSTLYANNLKGDWRELSTAPEGLSTSLAQALTAELETESMST